MPFDWIFDDKSEKLLLSGGKIISGQELAEECQMSRAAIWKAINSLREEGLEIEGSTNGGYRLLDNDIFNKNKKSYLKRIFLVFFYIIFQK